MYPRAVAAILVACGSNLDPGDAGGGSTTAGGATGAGGGEATEGTVGGTTYQCSGTTRSG